MADKRRLSTPESFGIFEIYQEAVNSRVLHGMLVIAIVFEFLQMYLGNHLIEGGFYQQQTLVNGRLFGYAVILIYLILMLIVYHRYDFFPDLIDVTVLGFILFHQLHTFINQQDSTISLFFWVVLSLLIGWQYIGPTVSVSVIGASYFVFIMAMYYYEIDLYNYLPMIWVMLITIPVALGMSIYRYRKEHQTYIDRTSLLENNTEFNLRLNVDELTGLGTSYALGNFILKHQELNTESAHVIYMDLDDLKVCNDLYGRDVGDTYIKTFASVVRFAVRDDRDIIAYLGNGRFVVVVTGAAEAGRLERRFERYNHLLREAFEHRTDEGRFYPHCSYGIAEGAFEDDFKEVIAEAEKNMYAAKVTNKRNLLHNSYLHPEINYISLFNESNITVIVWKASEGWPMNFVTENVEDLLGFSKSDFLGGEKLYSHLIHPDDIEKVEEEVDEHLRNRDKQYEQTYRLLTKEGKYIWIRDYSVPVWRSGELIQINGYIYDINLEMEAKTLLDEQTKRYSDIIEATKVGTWEWDIRSGAISINQRFADILGYPLDTLMPMNTDRREALVNREDLTRFREQMMDHVNGIAKDYELEYRLRHKSGNWIWVLDRGRVMKWTDNGEPEIMVGAVSDISEIKKTEALLRQSEKLNALGRMAGGIAHDMNNQLMMMRSFLDLVLEKNTLETYQENYEMMDRIVTRTSDTIKQLMTFTRHRIFEPKAIDMKNVMNEVLHLAERTFEKNLHIVPRFEVASAMIYGDVSLIENAVINIGLNAKDAMDTGGELILGLRKFNAEGPINTSTGNLPEGPYVVVEVTDNGSGIDDSHLEKVFEPFFTTKKKGEGIGLSTVVSVIKEHGGGLEVHTKLGEGTTFILYFPELLDTEEVTDTPALPAGTPQKDELPCIMVVDDEPVLAKVMTEFLAEKGCEVIPFTDPLKAVDFYRHNAHMVDVVLLDMLMPEMSGEEVFDELYTTNKEVRVLYLSGYSQGIKVKHHNKANVIGFMEKPVKLGEVYDRLISR